MLVLDCTPQYTLASMVACSYYGQSEMEINGRNWNSKGDPETHMHCQCEVGPTLVAGDVSQEHSPT